MRGYVKLDRNLIGNIEKVWTTDWGQKRISLVLDDEITGTLSIIDADAGFFEVLG